MPQNRRIVIPEALAETLNITESTVNEKMQEFVNRRAAIAENEQMFNESDLPRKRLLRCTGEKTLSRKTTKSLFNLKIKYK